MKITARFASTCPSCKGQIRVGSEVEWEKGQRARHVVCPRSASGGTGVQNAAPKTLLSGQGIPPAPKGTNKRAGNCEACGTYLMPGEGHLYKCIPDGDCMKHFDTDDGGWHVSCLDAEKCRAAKAQIKEAAKAKAEAAKAKAEAEKAAEEAAEAKIVALKAAFKAKGWESTMAWVDGLTRTDGAVLAAHKIGMYDVDIVETTWSDGTVGAVEQANSADDWRTYYWLPADVADAWRLAYAAKHGITREKAEEWMAKYSGCAGADVYRAVLACPE